MGTRNVKNIRPCTDINLWSLTKGYVSPKDSNLQRFNKNHMYKPNLGKTRIIILRFSKIAVNSINQRRIQSFVQT